MRKKYLSVFLACMLILSVFGGCAKNQTIYNLDKSNIASVNNSTALYAATDDLKRTLTLTNGCDNTKAVGVFYFLWLGADDGAELHDVSQIIKNDPNAAQDSVSWLVAGGGAKMTRHWWGESIFGHYFSIDQWVVERDVQMLTDAGVDFLALDYSNSSEYTDQLLLLLKVLNKYYEQGYEVPKITFITKNDSGKRAEHLFEDIYMGHPEYGHLWYQMDGRPLMIANESSVDLSDDAREYFTFLYPQWPREEYHRNGFPWIDFTFPQQVYGTNETTTIMSVSVNQHCGTMANSSSAFYGDTTNHTRSWHNGANETAEDSYLYGYNFAEQFENAIKQNPDIIFITGWNEWVATRLESWTGKDGKLVEDPVILVDNADINNSRDIQPMKGGYGDNYYMQMIDYIRRYKGTKTVNVGLNTAEKVTKTTIDVNKSIRQWDEVKSYYLDYIDEIGDRRSVGYGGKIYKDERGRNDIYKIKAAHDDNSLYFYIRTVEAISGFDCDHCLTLFINTGNKNNENWCGYDYVVNRKAPNSKGLTLEKRTASGWKVIGAVPYSLEERELQMAIPLSMIEIGDNSNTALQFKCVDNYENEDDLYTFYLGGDAAPYGRLNYVYDFLGIKSIPIYTPNNSKPTIIVPNEKN